MLCCVFWLVLPKCLGGKRLRCLGSKFLHRVNASAPASMWMVRYAISSTPFQRHIQWDCSALLSVVMCYLEGAARSELAGTPARANLFSTKLSGAEGVVGTPLKGIQQPSSFPPHPLIVIAIRSISFHLWVGSLLNLPTLFVMMQSSWLAPWSGVVVLNFSWVWCFVFVWLSCGRLVCCFCGCHICLRVVAESTGWTSDLVAKTNIRVAWGWRCLRMALLGVGTAWGRRCLRVALFRGGAGCFREWTIHGIFVITAKLWCNSVVINWCLLSYAVKVINK
jgi:hypothetical protein